MKNIFLAAMAALVTALVTVACGGSGDLCKDRNIRCEDPLSCDPDDGVCKCGGRGGVVCGEGQVCDALSNTCLSTKCAGVSCASQPGTLCDQLDGQCKCGGTGGQLCAENETCDPATKQCQANADCTAVACPVNQVCNPSTGACECGTSSCGAGESCTVDMDNNKACAADNCFGVKCSGDTSCDPADGRCKCNGAVCSAGSVCACPPGSDAGTCATEARTCQPGSACANVTCTGGTTCDPADGKCRCGGPGGPVCAPDQTCSLTSFQCQGGEQCKVNGVDKVCPLGTSCDPEDGVCKCGGRGGDVCASGADGGAEETCVETTFAQTCRQKCSPILQDCAPGQYCYFDTTSKTPAAYCAVNSDTKGAGTGCNNATACFTEEPSPRGLFCNGLGTFEQPGSTGFCRVYCDTNVGDGSCPGVPAAHCVSLPGGPPGVGFCEPQP